MALKLNRFLSLENKSNFIFDSKRKRNHFRLNIIKAVDFHFKTKHAKEVWSKFNCKDRGSYRDIYLKLDVCILYDIFESFRETSFQTYRLEPLYYFSTPGNYFT